MGEINFSELAAPINEHEVKTRKQGNRMVPYITARTVMNRLDKVVGPENWRDEYAMLPNGGVMCTLYLRVNDEWIGKSDVGTESNFEPIKGAYSDAFKRAAVRWGIGRELYNDGTAFDDEDAASKPAPKPNPRRIPDSTPPAPAEPSELDAHLGPRQPRGKADKPDTAQSPEARAKELARKTCPWDGAMQREPWQEFIEKYPEWKKKFWPAVQALGMDNDMAHEALGVESIKDWKGVNGKDTVAHLWYALVFAAIESELVDDKTA